MHYLPATTEHIPFICQTYLALEGLDNRVEIHWDDISLQDITQEAQAELYRAQAEKYRSDAENQ